VVVASASQMVPDLATALQQARLRYAPQWPSFLCFITGPSRTGDIERILVLGAHGPKRLTLFLLP
jgi:L-lactate dehydrogenase complex protein LldG